MGQKAHPYGLRLGYIKPWKTRWYARGKALADQLHEDLKIRKHLKEKLNFAGVSNIEYANNEMESIKETNGLVVCTEWLQFRSPDFERLSQELKDKVIFDGRNLYDPEKLKLYGLNHVGVGISSAKIKSRVV